LNIGLRPTFARIALLAGSIGLALTASTASAGTLKTGFLDPSNAALSDPSQELSSTAAINGVQMAGGQIARFYVYWRAVAGNDTPPANPADPDDPVYDWTAMNLQANVTAAQNAGLDILLTIRSAPNWAQRGGHDDRGTRDPSPSKLKDFTRAALARFPNVKYWGVWNEPNYRTFLSPQYRNGKLVSPKMYRTLLNTAAAVIHNHGKLVVASETAPFSHWSPKGRPTAPGPLLFVRKLLCMSGGRHPQPTCKTNVHADIWTTHPYTSGNVWHHALDKNSVSYGDLPDWTRLIKRAAKAKHITNKSGNHKARFWISEFSWDTKPIDPDAVPRNLHVRWTAESLYRAWKLGIEVVLWGQLRDYPISSAKFYGQYQSGLFYCDDTPTIDDSCGTRMDPAVTGPHVTAKPSLQAFRFPFVAYAGNGKIKIWGRTPNSGPGTVTITRFPPTGPSVSMGTVTANADGIFRKTYNSGVKKGTLQATFGSNDSAKFNLVRPKDKFFRPFGCGGVIECST
jgi:hypothetical protein